MNTRDKDKSSLTPRQGGSPPESAKKPTLVAEFSGFVGPIPPPDLLEKYERATPGAADRIFGMAEREQSHRHSRETEDALTRARQAARGTMSAFTLAVLALSGATYLGINNHDWLAGVFATTTIIGLVAAFLRGKKDEAKPSGSQDDRQ